MQSRYGYIKGKDVAHLDNDKFNNNLKNLKYLDRSSHRKHDGSNYIYYGYDRYDGSFKDNEGWRKHFKVGSWKPDYAD